VDRASQWRERVWDCPRAPSCPLSSSFLPTFRHVVSSSPLPPSFTSPLSTHFSLCTSTCPCCDGIALNSALSLACSKLLSALIVILSTRPTAPSRFGCLLFGVRTLFALTICRFARILVHSYLSLSHATAQHGLLLQFASSLLFRLQTLLAWIAFPARQANFCQPGLVPPHNLGASFPFEFALRRSSAVVQCAALLFI